MARLNREPNLSHGKSSENISTIILGVKRKNRMRYKKSKTFLRRGKNDITCDTVDSLRNASVLIGPKVK